MEYYVYILQSEKDERSYVGYTKSIDRRIAQHQEGKVKSTKNRRPLKIIYLEKFSSKKETMIREKFYKSGLGHEEIRKLKNKAPWPSG